MCKRSLYLTKTLLLIQVNEKEIQREQLANIFKLMNVQKDKFGVESMDDMDSQMKLYM